ncbi:hypothetical protein LGQ02_10025 [Bacillus shivajii]|uniref:hypothetical protein n=1 Tax=Bacillus shivajii TaxID=1983719 RepID=UPI001CFA200B|nr:hypothetical protein [Bacillus shivajii]UCZ55030.1 hypothetical protein LGQ02_10025 [Bacillus shivajii]
MMENGQVTIFAEYSTFEDVSSFNEAINQWMNQYDRYFTKGEKLALTFLTRYSVKVVGVSNVKIATILKVIHEEYGGNGISRSTFKRMVSKAKKIGMIKTYTLKRTSGGQSSNLYVFQPYPNDGGSSSRKKQSGLAQSYVPKRRLHSNEPPYQQKLNHLIKTKEYKTNKLLNKRKESLDHSYTSDYVPYSFQNLAKNFFDCADTIESYWRMVRICAYKNNYETEQNLMIDTAIKAFKQTVRTMKKKTIHRPIAYFYGVLNNKFEDIYMFEVNELIEQQ